LNIWGEIPLYRPLKKLAGLDKKKKTIRSKGERRKKTGRKKAKGRETWVNSADGRLQPMSRKKRRLAAVLAVTY